METITLDPAGAATTARAELDITKFVGPAGPDWGDAAIEAFKAVTRTGDVTFDHRTPNRTIQIPLVLVDRDGKTFEEIRSDIQAKTAILQAEGGWISRETALGTLYADVMSAALKLGGSSAAALGFVDVDAVLTLETLPEWYGDEIALDALAGQYGTIAATLTRGGQPAVIAGDVPARCRVLLTDGSNVNQLAAIAAVRSRHFDAAATARLAYKVSDLTPLDAATVTNDGLIYLDGRGPVSVIQHNSLANEWTPVASTQIAAAGAGHMTHRGSYRVLVRARNDSTTPDPPSLRLVWDVGDLTAATENRAFKLPRATDYFLCDLGEIRIDPVPYGTHRWAGQIQARGTAPGQNVQLQELLLVPVDESVTTLQAALAPSLTLGTFAARDEFTHASGNLAGKSVTLGGTWGGGGDADDFTINTTDQIARRVAISDTPDDFRSGRFATLGATTYSEVAVQADIKIDAYAGATCGVIARYTSPTQGLLAAILTPVAAASDLGVTLRVERLPVAPSGRFSAKVPFALGVWHRIRLVVDPAGRWWVWFGDARYTLPLIGSGQHSDLAAGGTLATGKVGLYDQKIPAGSANRDFDNLAVWSPGVGLAGDAVIYANRSAQARSDGAYRLDATGTSPGPIARASGDLPRLPPSGAEQRKIGLLARVSRGDLGNTPDTLPGAVTAQVFYRPTYLYVPAA